MTLRELESELSALGFRYARRSKCRHLVYTDGHGRLVVVAEKHGRDFGPKLVQEILRRAHQQKETQAC